MASASPNVVSTFQKSLSTFSANAGLSKDELKDFQLTSLDDLKLQISIIQNDQRKSAKLRYLKRLEPFLVAMEQYGQIVEVFLNVSDIIAFVWGPMKFLLMVASNYTEAFNALLAAYLEIGENLPQFTKYQDLFGSNAYMQITLAHIYEDILEFHKEALRYFRKPTWKQIFHATWRSFSKTVTHLAEDLRRHKSLIESQASLVQFEEIQNMRNQSQTHFEEYRLNELNRKRLSIQQWLCPLDVQSRHEDASESRYGNSGDWLLKDPRFVKWFDFDYCAEPLLWLSGIPGAGKTVLASRVVEECRKISRARTAFFYCRQTDEDRNPFLAVARTVLSQLTPGNDMILELLYEYETNSSEAVLSSSKGAKTLLETALKTCDRAQKTYIVIDGLDEYNRESRKEISTWFKEQVRNIPPSDLGHIRCLFVSQDDGYARKDLSDCSSIKLTPKDTRGDIESFCKMWQDRIAQKFAKFDPKQHNISEIVTARAQGMFLYAKLVTWNLYEQPTWRLFLQEICPDTLPDGLEQAYDRIIGRIIGPGVVPRSRSDNAKMLLGWLTCAKRTLRWCEIQGAVSIDLEDGTMSSDLQFQEDCKDLCASLVERSSDGSVALVHSTTKRYLINKGHVCVPEVEFDMAHLCLTYMSFEQFDSQASQDVIQTAIYRGDYSFADYASCFWALHIIAGVKELCKITSRDLGNLAEAANAFLGVQWASPKKGLTVPKTLEESLSALVDDDIYDDLCQSIVSSKNQLLPTGKGPSEDEPLHLPKVIQAIRSELEVIVSSPTITPTQKAKLEDFYGSKVFKCRRINCQFYSKGFATQTQRDHHISKHERAFTCKEEGCPQAVIGCVTVRDLQKHVEEYHGIAIDADAEYPEDEPEPDADANGKQNHYGTFRCTICPKTFTRAVNLRSHIRTHRGKPFGCDVCYKLFQSQGQMSLHKVIHLIKEKYICHGVLKTGDTWGCGRKFKDGKGLTYHYLATKSGRLCRKPVQDEDALEKNAMNGQIQQEGDPAQSSHIFSP
ncbi:hypothetical protein P280DRAFT_449775 [Massarina eburnea CBS 473.64]|uniref:C2H2-type domain-containing protein n=1 Tax=Massarina eburnea CBS 473.64 TaxID=1395130 RepID=A0A6A6S3S3_9PLEO|nr:hypothetical protein P280DRAFT_449775 [Massarina eburnea CBS 473.64]